MDSDDKAKRPRRQGLLVWGGGRAVAVLLGVAAVIAGSFMVGCRSAPARSVSAPQEASAPSVEAIYPPGRAVSLFDGESLGYWEKSDFPGPGDIYIEDDAIYMEMGSYATGITWAGPLVRMNYELALEAMRVAGTDFFCGLTFPVGKDLCTLILGGWGGTLCGLSSLDYRDASENETTTFVPFEKGTWYHVRLRVTENRIEVWLDGESFIDIDTTGRHIDIRMEMDPCMPLGIATWVTTGAVRNITLTKLPDPVE